jgi:hypothetical protein
MSLQTIAVCERYSAELIFVEIVLISTVVLSLQLTGTNAYFRVVAWVQHKIYFIIFICLAGFLINKSVSIYEKKSIAPLGELVQVTPEYNVNYWCTGPKNQ